MRLEGLRQLKNPMTSSGTEPAIFRLVAPQPTTLPRQRKCIFAKRWTDAGIKYRHLSGAGGNYILCVTKHTYIRFTVGYRVLLKMTRWILGNELQGCAMKWSWPNLTYYPETSARTDTETKYTTPARMAGFWAQTWTQDLVNTLLRH
jgi:hypothetical protein